MGVTNASTLIGIQKSFNVLYLDAFSKYSPVYPKVAMTVSSDGADMNHQWLGRVPQMREWIGAKVITEMRGVDWYVKNLPYEMTVSVKKFDIEDDKLGIYRPMVQQLGQRAATNTDKLLSDARVKGAATLCYDGQFFYDTDHAEGQSGAQSNVYGGSGVTLAALEADFEGARARLKSYKDDRGEPFIVEGLQVAGQEAQFLVTCPPALEPQFLRLFLSDLIDNTTNVNKGRAIVVCDSRLTDANDWYLDHVGDMIKPFLNQVRKAPELIALFDPKNSDHVFRTGEFLYGIESRGNVTYGLWQKSVKVTNT